MGELNTAAEQPHRVGVDEVRGLVHGELRAGGHAGQLHDQRAELYRHKLNLKTKVCDHEITL